MTKTKIKGKDLANTDAWENAITGVGTSKDKGTHTEFKAGGRIPHMTLEYMYEQDWIVGKICDAHPYEMTRKWIDLKSDASPETLEKINKKMTELDVVSKFKEALTWARLYGGCAIMMVVNDNKEPNEELIPDKAKELINLIVIDAKMLSPKSWQTDTSSKDYGEPETWQFATLDGAHREVHTSRLLKFMGIRVSDRARRRHKGWGASYVMRAINIIKNTQALDSGIATLISEAKYDTIYVPNLTELLMGEGNDELVNLYSNINMQKSITNSLLLDAEMKQERTTTQFSGLSEIQKNQLTNLSVAVDIPEFILGRNTGGLNAGQKEQLMAWYDKILSYQEEIMTKPLSKLIAIMRATEGIKDDVTFEYNSLFQLNDEELSRVKQTNAQTDSTYIREGVLTPDEVRKDLIENEVYNNIDDEKIADDELTLEDEQSIVEEMNGNDNTGDNNTNPSDKPDTTNDEPKQEVVKKENKDGIVDTYFKIKIIDKAKNFLIKLIKG